MVRMVRSRRPSAIRPPRWARSESWMQDEVGEQSRGAQVVAAGVVGGAGGQALAGVDELLADAGGLEAVGLLGVEALVAGADLGEVGEVGPPGRPAVPGSRPLLRMELDSAPRRKSTISQGVGDAVFVLEDQHVPGDLGGDVGVAVAVAADPGAEGQRAGAGRQRDADAFQFGGEVLQHVADGVLRGVRRGSRRRCGPRRRVLGVPPAVRRSATAGRCSRRGAGPGAGRSGGAAGGVEEFGDAAQLVQHAAAGGLGGVRGEDRPDVEVPDGLAQVLGVGVLEAVGGAGEQSALGGAAGAQLAAAVDLLGDVGQVEVGGEGAHQLGGGVQVGLAEQRAAASPSLRVRARTCSTRSRSSGPSWRTRVSPRSSPRRLMSARSAALSVLPGGPAGVSATLTGAAPCYSVRVDCEGMACGADRAVRPDQDMRPVT